MIYSPSTPPALPLASDSHAVAWGKAYGMGVNPSLGINAAFVGGDLGHGGFELSAPFRTTGQHVVWKQEQADHPSNLIVFGESKLRGGGVTEGDEGYHLLTPPFAGSAQWQPNGDGFEVVNTLGLVGLTREQVRQRHGNRVHGRPRRASPARRPLRHEDCGPMMQPTRPTTPLSKQRGIEKQKKPRAVARGLLFWVL